MSGWITVTVAQVMGSAPREAGASMRVFADHQEGTIGGGRLEWEAAKVARQMLADGKTKSRQTMPLGPNLGQCCGGTVVLDFIADSLEDEPMDAPPLWIWGAGHTGEAICRVMAPLPGFEITLVDFDAKRLPDNLPDSITPVIAKHPAQLVPHAPTDAHHIILTHDHGLDLELCHALLNHGFTSCGVIGSATKWARFQKRLFEAGHTAAKINTIRCPIGNPALGKHPAEIAVGVAGELLAYGNETSVDTTTGTEGEIAS